MKTDDPRTWMWSRALEVLAEAERLQKQFFHLGRSATLRPAWEPPVDIYEAQGTMHIVVALPGVSPERLKVLAEDQALVISGDRPLPWEEGRAEAIHRMEIPYGHFERRIEGLPAGLERTRTLLCDGCLFLTFEKGKPPCV